MWFLYYISFMWIWNRQFMTGFTTTVFGRCYFPDGYVKDQPGEAAHTLAHEGVHAADGHGREPWFSLSYLFPQVLVLLALLSFFSLWFLLALVFLLPLPAPWREHWEKRGYTMTAVGSLLQGENIDADDYVDWLADQFSGFGYYRMSWSRARGRIIAHEIIADAKAFVAGTKTEPYVTATIKVIQHA